MVAINGLMTASTKPPAIPAVTIPIQRTTYADVPTGAKRMASVPAMWQKAANSSSLPMPRKSHRGLPISVAKAPPMNAAPTAPVISSPACARSLPSKKCFCIAARVAPRKLKTIPDVVSARTLRRNSFLVS